MELLDFETAFFHEPPKKRSRLRLRKNGVFKHGALRNSPRRQPALVFHVESSTRFHEHLDGVVRSPNGGAVKSGVAVGIDGLWRPRRDRAGTGRLPRLLPVTPDFLLASR